VREPPGSLRIQVLADESGQIICGFFPGTAEGDNPPRLELVPDEGQVVRDVELPEDLLGEKGLDLDGLLSYRLEAGTQSRLTRG
jgi:hypothetical protein